MKGASGGGSDGLSSEGEGGSATRQKCGGEDKVANREQRGRHRRKSKLRKRRNTMGCQYVNILVQQIFVLQLLPESRVVSELLPCLSLDGSTPPLALDYFMSTMVCLN